MDRRRSVKKRPASSEEVQCWSHATESLSNLSNYYASPTTIETVGRVNRLIGSWPGDETLQNEQFNEVKGVYKKLHSGLTEIRNMAEKEAKDIEHAIERLDVLLALRRASEAHPPEKRVKRPRGASPAIPTAPATPPLLLNGRGMSSQRNSVGPSPAIPFSREPKARREALANQLPLEEGRKVAYHPKPGDGTAAGTDENTWILAVVTKCINQDKNRYEVQDAEPQEDGQPGMCYKTTLRSIIPLPDPNAPPNSPAHLNAYQAFQPRSIVMALYPDTSCFYRAEVIASPRDLQPSGRGAPSMKHIPTYKLKFEDDDDQEHSVAAQWVVEWPGS